MSRDLLLTDARRIFWFSKFLTIQLTLTWSPDGQCILWIVLFTPWQFSDRAAWHPFFSDFPFSWRIYVCDRFQFCLPVDGHIPGTKTFAWSSRFFHIRAWTWMPVLTYGAPMLTSLAVDGGNRGQVSLLPTKDTQRGKVWLGFEPTTPGLRVRRANH